MPGPQGDVSADQHIDVKYVIFDKSKREMNKHALYQVLLRSVQCGPWHDTQCAVYCCEH
jgi:L-lactate utilization protein LutB